MAKQDPADKEVRKDAKLQNLVLKDAQAAEDLWRFRYPEEGGTKLGFEEIQVEISLRYGFSVALSTLSNFYIWFKLQRRMDAKATAAEQFMQELAKDKSFSVDQVKRAGQRLFMTEGIMEENSKKFVSIVECVQNDERLEQNKERIGVSKKIVDLHERRIKLLEEKAAEAKAKLVALTTTGKSKGGITPETLALIEEAARLL